jgi:hypothetical protein
MQPAARWSLLVPLVPALLLTVAIVQGREKTTFGEVTTAIAFAGVAVPVVLAAGRTWPVAAIVAVPFALSFIAGTLAVRVVILRVRGGGDPRAMRHTRHAAFGLVACATAALAIATGTSVLPAAVLIAAAPGLLMGAAIAARPPAPSRLRTIGWTLVAVSFLTAFTIIAGAA